MLRQILTTLHDNLLRDIYDIALHCYEDKPPPIGYTIHVLQDHIYDDLSFSQATEEYGEFKRQLHKGLQDKAFELYKNYLEKHLPQDQQQWEFYHVIELGKAVLALAQKIQKRYRKNPEIMGYVPLPSIGLYLTDRSEKCQSIDYACGNHPAALRRGCSRYCSKDPAVKLSEGRRGSH